MAIPFFKEMRIGGYLLKQKLLGRKRYPLVLMLEPLFRCNLACVGCGKIDYPDAILNRRMTAQECWDAADECGAPMVAIPGGEPLIHKEIGEIVRGLVARKKFVSLCTNALLLEKKLDLFEPSPYLFFSVHLDGLKDHHDKAVSQKGVFDRAVSAIKAAKARGFTVNVNATIFDGHPAEEIAKFLDLTVELGVGVSMSPGYAYERAPDQEHFLNRTKTKKLFRDVFAMGKGKKWNFMHSGLFLDFLAGNQEYECTPWGMPARNIFGWQKPCYLLGEGYAKTFKELMDTTDWETYGTGKYEKCADCMAHCGYEPTAATAALNNPLKAMWVSLRGVKTSGPMAPEIDMSKQRPAQYIFSEQVQKKLSEIRQGRGRRRAGEGRTEGLDGRVRRETAPRTKRPGRHRDRAFSFVRSRRSDCLGDQRLAVDQLGADQEVAATAQGAQRAVEVDAGRDQRMQRRRVAHDSAQHGREVDLAVRLDGGAGERRQRAMGGVADDADRGKGQPRLGGVGGRDVAFHVDGGGAGLRMQRRLAGPPGDHFLGAGEAAAHHAAAP
ncbi:hopanoid biosynthesis associated radical SAM protein HpnH [Bradyrhizobium diazoefficiens]